MIRKRNKYSRPKKSFEIARIKEENALLKKYALKSKIEVWKNLAKVDYFRKRAKALAKSSVEEQNVLFDKLRALGLNTNTITDVLALKIEDILERRLPTVVFKKGLAKSTQEARQMVAHKRIMINKKVINIPSYLVSLVEENSITLKKKIKSEKTEAPKKEEAAPAVQEAQDQTTQVQEQEN